MQAPVVELVVGRQHRRLLELVVLVQSQRRCVWSTMGMRAPVWPSALKRGCIEAEGGGHAGEGRRDRGEGHGGGARDQMQTVLSRLFLLILKNFTRYSPISERTKSPGPCGGCMIHPNQERALPEFQSNSCWSNPQARSRNTQEQGSLLIPISNPGLRPAVFQCPRVQDADIRFAVWYKYF